MRRATRWVREACLSRLAISVRCEVGAGRSPSRWRSLLSAGSASRRLPVGVELGDGVAHLLDRGVAGGRGGGRAGAGRRTRAVEGGDGAAHLLDRGVAGGRGGGRAGAGR